MGAKATEAEAVLGARQIEGRKRSVLERSPARGSEAAKVQRAEAHAMEMEASNVEAAVGDEESGQQLLGPHP